MEVTADEIETKLSAARTRLILERPFIGSLVMHLPLIAADPAWCQTSATNAKAFYYNPQFIASLSLSQTQFVLAHEALHCALGHFARRRHRVTQRWNIACDHAVNLLLLGEGLRPPSGILADEKYEGLTAEEIYPMIAESSQEQTMDRHMFDDAPEENSPQRSPSDAGEGGKAPENGRQGAESDQTTPQEDAEGSLPSDAQGRSPEKREPGEARPSEAPTAGTPEWSQPADLAPGEKEALEKQWQQRLASAAQQAKQAGKLGESWLRAIDELIQPQLPWRMLLARYMMSVSRDDFSFQRPSRREGDAFLPSLHSAQVDVVVVVDTSGSVTDIEMREFVSEVEALKSQIHARVTLHACDEALAADGPWVYAPWEALALPDGLSGGGGTSFVPPFEWVEERQLRPDLLLYFTDAEGEFPPEPPSFPVIWLIKGKAPVPWGERIQLN